MCCGPNTGRAYMNMLEEKADRENMGKPLQTVHQKAAQRPSSTALGVRKKVLKGLSWHGIMFKLSQQHFQPSLYI